MGFFLRLLLFEAFIVGTLFGCAGRLDLPWFWATRVNRFFSPVVRIQAERGHHVVTTGPYALVRHPGYLGALLITLCSGPALGSWWSMLPIAGFVVLFLRRLVVEDRYLHEHLEGYKQYAENVRYRLLPGIW